MHLPPVPIPATTTTPQPGLLRSTIGIVFRLFIGAALAIWLVVVCGTQLAQAFLPILKWTFVQLDDRDRLIELVIAERGAISGQDRVYRLVVAPDKPVYIGGRIAAVNPQGRATVSVLVAYLWQAAVIALPLTLAWPARARRELFTRLAVLPLLLACLALLDLPFVLWAQVWQGYVDAYEPDRFSPLLIWVQFLQGGGRLLVGILAASGSVLVAQRVLRPKSSGGHALSGM